MVRHTLAFLVTFVALIHASAAHSSEENFVDDHAELTVLALADRSRYQEIFRLQEASRWTDADQQIARLSDRLLMGHVLAQRYLHPTAYRSNFDELADWLRSYPDHPQAKRIYRLARKWKPNSEVKLPKPIEKPDSLLEHLPPAPAYRSELTLSHSQYELKRQLQRRIRRYIARTYLSKTQRLLQDDALTRVLDRYELDKAYADLAAAWLYYGDAETAFRLAGEVAWRSGSDMPIAHWTAGLSAWMLGQYRHATQHFMRLAMSNTASDWNRAAGAYWAARAYHKEINLAEAMRWLIYASHFGETFYGLLAVRRLGERPTINFRVGEPEELPRASLMVYPEGRRALALLEIGADSRAEQELLWFNRWQDLGIPSQLAALSNHATLPLLGFRLVTKLHAVGTPYQIEFPWRAIAYPLIPWRPQGGFKLDRALILAFIRQESSFDPSAQSPDGARGLMQLMPKTASAIARATGTTIRQTQALYDPALNMKLGQSYLLRLLRSPRIRRDLLRLAVAYNAGPGNLAAWDQSMGPQEDPLLFLETLPSRETRLFVERVMTNLWIYRIRLGQTTPSLDTLAAGRWPKYSAQDPPERQLTSSRDSPS